MAARKSSSPLKDFNLNSIIVLAATALVGWLVTNGLSSLKDTKTATIQTSQSVAEIKTALPFITKSQDRLETDVKALQSDVKEVRSTSITRTELDSKHNRILQELNEVKAEQKNAANKAAGSDPR